MANTVPSVPKKGKQRWNDPISSSTHIRELRNEDLAKTAEFYAQGVLMEVPPGSTAPLEELIVIMRMDLELYLKEQRNRVIWLAVENEVVKGIVDFFLEPPRIRIRFLGAIPPNTGTGTCLLVHLARFCLSKKLGSITAEVSKSDPRAWNFYFNHIGFQDQGRSTDEPGLILHLAEIKPQVLLDNLKTEY